MAGKASRNGKCTRPGLILNDNSLSKNVCAIVKHAYNYFAKEKQSGRFLIDPEKIRERTALASGRSKYTVHHILKDARSSSKFITPHKKKHRKKAFEKIPILSRNLIRLKVYKFYKEGKRINLDDIYKEVSADGFVHSFQRSTFRAVIKDIGFICRVYAGRRLLLEKDTVVIKRCKFYKSMADLNCDDVVWVGETFFKPPAKTNLKNPYLLILHIAGNSRGFVVKTTCTSHNPHQDNRKHVSPDYFKKWIEKLLDTLPSGSSVVLSSKYSHDSLAERVPNIYTDKDSIRNWLNKYNVPVDDRLSKPELLDLVKLSKPVIPTYALDSYVAGRGFNLIRVPPHHEHFNAAELILEKITNNVDKLKAERTSIYCFPCETLEDIVMKSFNAITSQDWCDAVSQAAELIDSARSYERTLEDSIQSFIQGINNRKKSGREDLINTNMFYRGSDSDLTEASDSDSCAEDAAANNTE